MYKNKPTEYYIHFNLERTSNRYLNEKNSFINSTFSYWIQQHMMVFNVQWTGTNLYKYYVYAMFNKHGQIYVKFIFIINV